MTPFARSLALSIAAGAFALAAGFAAGTGGAHADVSPRGVPERDWRDKQGRVIKRLDRHGRLTLLQRDEMTGRIVQVAALTGTYTPKTAESPIEGPPAWTHWFEYDDAGTLVIEVDCDGVRHSFGPGNAPRLDDRNATALTGHRHFNEAGARCRVPKRLPSEGGKVHYDDRGNVEKVERVEK